MIKVATCLWQPNRHTKDFSNMYDETWVEKLYRGFARNLTLPFEFICFTDRKRNFNEPLIQQRALGSYEPDYGCMIEPFRLEGPKIIVGLDTIIVRNIDHMQYYCMEPGPIALPKDPYFPARSINGVALVPPGNEQIYEEWAGGNDMEHLRKYPWLPIDNAWPGEVLSLKFHDIRRKGLQNASIVYFHGRPKPNELLHLDWVKEHWR